MKVFVAGATGVLGRSLVPLLVEHGHEVVGMTRSESKKALVRELGARPVVADALDYQAVTRAVASTEPEVLVHELSQISSLRVRDGRHVERALAMTNRLRTEGTDNLLAAGQLVGVQRFVAQSFGAWRWSRAGGPALTEAETPDPDPPISLRPNQEANLYLERAVTAIDEAEGIVLRYGAFYGPGTAISLAPDAQMAVLVRKRRFPIIGDGAGIWSHIHVGDAAAATAAAVDRGQSGIHNVVDDEPAPVRDWLPVLATALEAKPPRHVPLWLSRLAAGEMATAMMTQVRGASNMKAKRELGWQPVYASWRQGFEHGLE